jgi:hypothetical protein
MESIANPMPVIFLIRNSHTAKPEQARQLQHQVEVEYGALVEMLVEVCPLQILHKKKEAVVFKCRLL